MKVITLEEKRALIRATREANYIESLRLEGISTKDMKEWKSKAHIIAFYTCRAVK